MLTAEALTPALLATSYASIVLLHTTLQERFRKQYRPVATDNGVARPPGLWPRPPSVDIIVPTFDERPEILEACFASLALQDYEGQMRVVAVDDGSSNLEQLLPVYRKYQQLPGWTVLIGRNGNQGKRKAQDAAIYGAAGWQGSRAEFVLMVDSDTVVAPDGVRWILKPFVDGEVAAVTGDVGLLNRDENRLTGLIHKRYRLLFRHERAAQSHFGKVFCCAGPFSAYRRQDLDDVWSLYMERKFGWAPCTFGDDLQLTNLMLEQGRKSIYQSKAEAFTTVPTTLRAYLRQQWRWNRSFYRQFWWIRPFLRRNRHPYQVFDLVARAVPALLLMGALVLTLVDLATFDLASVVRDLTAVAVMATVGLTAVVWQTRQLGFAVLYGSLYVALLLPARAWALFTLTNSQWSTRG